MYVDENISLRNNLPEGLQRDFRELQEYYRFEIPVQAGKTDTNRIKCSSGSGDTKAGGAAGDKEWTESASGLDKTAEKRYTDGVRLITMQPFNRGKIWRLQKKK